MSYTTDLINQRRGQTITGSQVGGSQVDKKPSGKLTFTQQVIESRRQGFSDFDTSRQRISSEPITISQPENNRNFFKKTSDFLGIGTGELKGVFDAGVSKAKELIATENKGEKLLNFGKNVFNSAKTAIIDEVEKDKKQKQEYFGEGVDLKKLTYEQIRDYQADKFLDLAKPDIEEDLKKLESKQNKSKIDEYRIKNIKGTLAMIDEARNAPRDKKKNYDSMITGLALSRGTGSLTAGLLGIGESFFDFVKWRGDVAGTENISQFSEKAGDRINQWADEVRPNNPQMADKLLEGVGSTIPFYVTGLGVSSLAGRLATVSPKVAQIVGVGSSALMEAGLEAGSTYQLNIDRGMSHEEADKRASRVFAGNVLFNYFTDKVGIFNDGEGVKRFIISGMGEGTQESWQNALQNLALDEDPTENIGETFLLSFITGAGLNSFGQVVQDPAVRAELNEEDLKKLDTIAEAIEQSEGDPQKFNQILEEKGINAETQTTTEEKPEEETKVEPTPEPTEVVSPTDGGEVAPGLETKKEVETVGGGEEQSSSNVPEALKELAQEVKDLKSVDEISKTLSPVQLDTIKREYRKVDEELSQKDIYERFFYEATGRTKVPDNIPLSTMEDLAEATKYYETEEDFVRDFTASDLLDLTNPQKHRFGRLFDQAEDGRIMDTVDTVKQYRQDLQYYPDANVPMVTNPNARVTIYRGTVKDQKSMLPGDFVTFSRDYALTHNEGQKLLKKTVPAKDVIWQGNDFNEWVYSPASIRSKYSSLEDFYQKEKKSPDKKPVKQAKTVTKKEEAKKTPEKKSAEQKTDKKKPTEPKKEIPKAQEPGKTKASKVAVSIEQKLGEKLENVAGFEGINIKDQLRQAEELLNKNLIRARGMISGKIPLPDGLRGGAFIKAVEEYAKRTDDMSLLRSLAVSPLVSETSIHAQELRLLAERDQNSVLSKMQEIANERAKIAEKKYGQKVDKLLKDETQKIKDSIRKPNKHSWSDFLKEIEC